MLQRVLAGGARVRTAEELLGELRGTKGLRPKVDPGLAGGLRARLDDAIYGRFGRVPAGSVSLSTKSFAPMAVPTSRGLLRGALVARLIPLHVAGVDVASPLDDAIESLRAGGRDASVIQRYDSLDIDERGQLAAELRAHHSMLRKVLPAVPARWSPRCSVRQAVELVGGGLSCRGVVDLAIGTPGGTRACVCLVDVTTSPIASHHELICNYLALLETVRTGEQPLRVAVVSTADGRSIVRDVNAELLSTAIEDVLEAMPASRAA